MVKRSDEVRTYRGLWAGFSGYVERLPLQQAYLELSEEAGLSSDQIDLQGIGVPICVDDDANRLKWVVLPFLFRLAPNAKIHIDRESTECGWFSPEEISELETVPGLYRALCSVWPAF